MSALQNPVGSFACGHPFEWSNTFFDAAHMVHCIACLREGAVTAANPATPLTEAPVEAQAPAGPVESSEVAESAAEASSEEESDVAAEVQDETAYSGLTIEQQVAIRAAGGYIPRKAMVKVPRTKKIKDMTPEEKRAYKAAYSREYNRIKGGSAHDAVEQMINFKSSDYPTGVILGISRGDAEVNPDTGRYRRNSLVKVRTSKPVNKMTEAERDDYNRAYRTAYYRVKSELEGTSPAARLERKSKEGDFRVQVMEPETQPLPSEAESFTIKYDQFGVAQWLPGESREDRLKRRQRAATQRYVDRQRAAREAAEKSATPKAAEVTNTGFVVRYDEYGVAQWLEGETIAERKKRRAEARLEREIAKQKTRQKKSVGRLYTPGAPKVSAEQREKNRVRALEYYHENKERIRAGISAKEAKETGWKPSMAFSHA